MIVPPKPAQAGGGGQNSAYGRLRRFFTEFSAISFQLSAFSFQLSAISSQLSVFSFRFRVIAREMQVVVHLLSSS
jgi:hypothetical protein